MFTLRSNRGNLGIKNLLVLLLVVLFALPRVGICDEDDDDRDYDERPQPTKEQVGKAGTLFQEGSDNFSFGNYGTALDKFNEAFELVKNSQKYAPDLLYNMAKCEVKLGKLREAVGHYRLYIVRAELRVRKPGLKPEEVLRQTGELQRAEEEIARLEARMNGLPEKPTSSPPTPDPVVTTPPPDPSSSASSAPKRYFPVASTVLGSLTLVFAATAAGTYGVGNSTYNMLLGPGGCSPACSNEQIATYQRPLYASYAFWGLAGAGLLTFAIVLPFELKKAKKSAVRLSWLHFWPAG